ncbi:hypothetical protein D0Z67_02775 [Streptomyces seoulensis]|uniref:Uncharacterized protein n=1 Tax=Streptomyces seoulensis TaxID=73044 RepID=A0A4P6TPX0_STRSO|nr:hypothetical protein [Streptomyces seoulensis]QBJ89339.1 hypothetical protein D0Z67_02775 [Streptomyces seoulensis]
MRTHRHGTDRDGTHGPDTDRARRAGAPAPPLLALQRSAGNAAVSRLVADARTEDVVQRSPEPSRPPSRTSQKSGDSQETESSQESAHSMTAVDRRKIKFAQDKAELLGRVGRIEVLKNVPGFMSGLDAFLDNIEADMKAGQPTAVDGAAIDRIIDGFHDPRVQGHRVQYSWFVRQQGKEGFQGALDRVAAGSTEHGHLWSKMNSAIPTEDASVGHGVVLEASIQGRIFDGLLFGLPTWSASDALAALWKRLSTTYVQALTGTVTAHALDGTVGSSVLSTLEWPELRASIADNRVDGLSFVVYRSREDPSGGPMILEPVETFQVRTQDEFDNLPEAPADQSWRDGQRVIDQQQRAALADIHSREDEILALDEFVSDLFRRHGRDLRFRDTRTPPNTRSQSARESPRSGSPGGA